MRWSSSPATRLAAGFQVGNKVVVVGAGNTAIDAANAAKRLGRQDVHILYRREEQRHLGLQSSNMRHAKRAGIQFHWNTIPTQIHHDGKSWPALSARQVWPGNGEEFRKIPGLRIFIWSAIC